MGWKKLIAPSVLLGIVLALSGYIWTSMAGDVDRVERTTKENRYDIKSACKESEARDKELDKKKVDNRTMQMQIKLQQMQITQNKEEFDRIYKEIEQLKK